MPRDRAVPTLPELGVLMLATTFPRLVGDVGHPESWSMPVRFRVVERATSARVVRASVDRDLLPDFVEAARELQDAGARIITTSCGFLAAFQGELVAAVDVPVLSSALLHVPLLERSLARDARILVLTASRALSDEAFGGVGTALSDRLVVRGFEPDGAFASVYVGGAREADVEAIRAEVVAVARDAARDPSVAAVVLECTNLSPFRRDIGRATGLPVFDLVGLVTSVHAALPPRALSR